MLMIRSITLTKRTIYTEKTNSNHILKPWNPRMMNKEHLKCLKELGPQRHSTNSLMENLSNNVNLPEPNFKYLRNWEMTRPVLTKNNTSRRVRYRPTFWLISCVCTQRETNFSGESGSPKPGHQGFLSGKRDDLFSRVFECLF